MSTLFSYDCWLEYRYGKDPADQDYDGSYYWGPGDEHIVEYVAHAFEDTRRLVDIYSAARVARVIDAFFYEADYGVFGDTSCPYELRTRLFRSIVPVYRDLYASLCGNALGHKNQPTQFACYMWWELIPWVPDREPLIDDVVYEVFEALLSLPSEACQESALHGLGHAHDDKRGRSLSLIRIFLEREGMSPELRQYAENALTGGIN